MQRDSSPFRYTESATMRPWRARPSAGKTSASARPISRPNRWPKYPVCHRSTVFPTPSLSAKPPKVGYCSGTAKPQTDGVVPNGPIFRRPAGRFETTCCVSRNPMAGNLPTEAISSQHAPTKTSSWLSISRSPRAQTAASNTSSIPT